VYGLTTPIENKINPFVLNFHEYRDMIADIRQSDGIRESLFFMFGSPGKIYQHKIASVKKGLAPRASARKEPALNRFLKAAILILVVIFCLNESSSAQRSSMPEVLPTPKGEHLLFFLQRNPDANTVIYELNFEKEGKLNEKRLVKGSWIRYEEAEKFKELTAIEQKFAYGVKCKALGNDTYEIRLVAYKKLPLYLKKSQSDHKYRIYIKDEGKDLLLKRVFVRVNGGTFWFPKVEYIDLITTNSSTGLEFLKRINI
jgi:hypothetical protein